MARIKKPRSHYARMSKKRKSKIRPFVFFELPTELRLEIYRFILSIKSRNQSHVFLNNGEFSRPENKRRMKRLLALQLTCQATKAEVVEVFSAENIFTIVKGLPSKGGSFTPGFDDNMGYEVPCPIDIAKLREFHVVFHLCDEVRRMKDIDWTCLERTTALQKVRLGFTRSVHESLDGWLVKSFMRKVMDGFSKCLSVDVKIRLGTLNTAKAMIKATLNEKIVSVQESYLEELLENPSYGSVVVGHDSIPVAHLDDLSVRFLGDKIIGLPPATKFG